MNCKHRWQQVENSEKPSGEVLVICTICGESKTLRPKTESRGGRRVLLG